jgi:dsRNA-specific ribonuclease
MSENEKWHTRLTVTTTKRPHKNRTSSRIKEIKNASKLGVVQPEVNHESLCHDTLRSSVNAALTTIWGTTTNVRNRIHNIDHYVESLQTKNASETLFIQSLWDLAILNYLQTQNGSLSRDECVQIRNALITNSALIRYVHYLELSQTYALPSTSMSLQTLQMFLIAYYKDQLYASKQIRNELPIHSTQKNSALYHLFLNYSPEAQALEAVQAFIGRLLDQTWTVFFGVNELSTLEWKSLIKGEQSDYVSVFTSQFQQRFQTQPKWEYGITKDAQYTCNLHHVDGALLAKGVGSTHFEAKQDAAQKAMSCI